MTKRPNIVGLGEVLWDLFPTGPRFGGAPANFAASASELSRREAHVHLVSSVGRDELGERALAALAEHGVQTSHVAPSSRPTGSVLVTLDASGAASYRFAADTAWDSLCWSQELEQLARQTDAVCFGTLGQRSRPSQEVIERFLRVTRPEALRVLDVNLRPPHWSEQVVLSSLKQANVLKLNDGELPVIAYLLRIQGTEQELLAEIARLYSLRLVALTRGERGSLLVSADGECSEAPAPKVKIVNTVGAGDAFTAALVLGLCAGAGLEEINVWANRAAAHVCSQPGATTTFPESILAAAPVAPLA